MAVPDFTRSLVSDVSDITIGLPKEYYTDALNREMREKVETAVKVLRAETTTSHIEEHAQIYDRLFPIYQDLYAALKDSSERISEIYS